MSLMVWLPLNGNLDNQGLNNIQATTTGTTIVSTGKIGSCYQFGTAASDIQIPKEAMTSLTTETSVCFWIKIISWNTSYATFFQAGTSSTAWSAYIFGLLRNNANSTCCFTISNGSSASNASYLTPAFELDKWYHISLIYKTGHCLIYINGELYQDYATSIVPNFSGITTIRIGRCTNGSSYQTNCLMNDFRIYDEALSPKEIKNISRGLVCHYTLSRPSENLLSRYVSPGQQNPNVTSTAGRTNYYGDYGIIIPATENADTYFRLYLKEQLVTNETYTISCNVSGLLNGSYYRFPLFSQGNTSMGVLNIDHNGICSLTFQMTYSTQSAVSVGNETVYVCFMDDSARALASGQGSITLTNFKIEKGNIATPWIPANTDPIYSFIGLDSNIEEDVSGYGNDGTRIGTFSWSSDTPRYVVSTEFNGSQYIQLPFPCGMISEAVTVTCWGYESNWNTTYAERLIGAATSSSGWCIGDYGSENTLFAFYANGSYNTASGFKQLSDGWHHFVITFDGINLKYYVDGALFSSKTFSAKQSVTGVYNIQIGQHYGGTCNFRGNMSDVRIYATALSADDVLELYHAPISLSNNGTLMTQGEYVEV